MRAAAAGLGAHEQNMIISSLDEEDSDDGPDTDDDACDSVIRYLGK